MIHPKYGLGVKLRMADARCKYTTMMREAISIALSKEDMAEGLRVFHVALTRAEGKADSGDHREEIAPTASAAWRQDWGRKNDWTAMWLPMPTPSPTGF